MDLANGISVGEFLEENGQKLALELLAGKDGLDRQITDDEIHRPGLALAGFVELYTFDRIQVLGNTELLYLAKLSESEMREALETIYQFDLPCVVVTNDRQPPPAMFELSDQTKIPLLKTRFATTKFVHLFSLYADEIFAPRISIHGTLVDVYGIGLLFTGRSAIGKSEIALDLVERGHRLVADDVVIISRLAHGILVGTGSDIIRNYMEIRGIGIVDVRNMFGIRAIRRQKRIEVEVQLVDWDDSGGYERIGLEDQLTTILDVEVPVVTVPIYPGKNITVIAEVIALTHLLKISGYHPAKEFNKRLIDLMKRKNEGSFLGRDIE